MVIKLVIYGKVRTHNKITYTKKHGARLWKDRILKEKISKKDHCARVELWKDGKHKTVLVHRLVADTFLEKLINSKMTVNHKDGNRLNNRLDNLEWLSIADNIRYGFENGQYSTCKKCILTDCNGNKFNFVSLARASEFLERNKGYISYCLKNNNKIIDQKGAEYKIEVLV